MLYSSSSRSRKELSLDPQDVERREFFRLNFKSPLKFKTYAERPVTANSRNISQSGILFQTEEAPKLSSLLWLSLDMRTLKICQEIESRALVLNNGLVGKVVRVEEDPGNHNSYDVGVCFLGKDDKGTREVQELI